MDSPLAAFLWAPGQGPGPRPEEDPRCLSSRPDGMCWVQEAGARRDWECPGGICVQCSECLTPSTVSASRTLPGPEEASLRPNGSETRSVASQEESGVGIKGLGRSCTDAAVRGREGTGLTKKLVEEKLRPFPAFPSCVSSLPSSCDHRPAGRVSVPQSLPPGPQAAPGSLPPSEDSGAGGPGSSWYHRP